MTRAVIDPGVFVSAFIGRSGSVPDQLLRAWRRERYELIVSPLLFAELATVLGRPKFAKQAGEGRADDFLAVFARHGTAVDDPPGGAPVTRDPKDDYLVRLALATRADVLVSGDRDLLEADLATPTVLSPRAFLEMLRQR